MNIILIGYRGTGKTVVGKLLADRLDKKLVSTDKTIVKRAGMSILKIVEKYGWKHFRNLEQKVIEDITKGDNLIIDCGGGVIVRDTNIENLKNSGKIFLLRTDPKTIAERIRHDDQRPSLTEDKSFVAEIEEVLAKRRERYNKAKDFCIDTTQMTPNEVTDKIIKLIEE